MEEHSEENLIFWKRQNIFARIFSENSYINSVEEYRSIEDVQDRKKKALEIYGEHLRTGSQYEINISHAVKENFKEILEVI
jgi:hypothetical protein